MSRCVEGVRLADFASGRLSNGALDRVSRHVDECARCASALDRVRGARSALSSVAALPAPAESSAGWLRMEAALRWSRTNPVPKVDPPRPWLRWAFMGVAATACAVAVVVVVKHHRAGSQAPIVAKAAPSVGAPAMVAPAAAALPAYVTLVAAPATVHGAKGVDRPLDPTVELAAGDVLSTGNGGRVAFQWGDGSGALLGSSSSLTVARLDHGKQQLELTRGRLALRAAGAGGESVQVATATHVVTLQRTWCVVASDGRGTSVEVLEGTVEVASHDGSASMRLAAPMRAYFPSQKGGAVAFDQNTRAMSAREAAALRAANEMHLMALAELAETGILRVRPEPAGATVAIDGISLGSPLGDGPLLLRQKKGGHLIELSRPGFEAVSKWITVDTGAPHEITIALPQAPRVHTDTTANAPDEVSVVAATRKRQVQACYERALKRNTTLAGTINLMIDIGSDGNVSGTRVDSDTLDDPDVTACLMREVGTWSFITARNASVVFPFAFSSR